MSVLITTLGTLIDGYRSIACYRTVGYKKAPCLSQYQSDGLCYPFGRNGHDGDNTRRSQPEVAVLAIAGGLFHLVNHAAFKGLLFLNAGAIEYTLGTRDLKEMGGLARSMPATSATSFIASYVDFRYTSIQRFLQQADNNHCGNNG